MRITSFILNLPYTLIGLLVASVSGVNSVKFRSNPLHFLANIKNWWWAVGYMRGARAVTIGNVVLLGNKTQKLDYEHEIVHVRQYENYPLIYPFLYYLELFRKGYKQNKFEEEAYRLSGNKYAE